MNLVMEIRRLPEPIPRKQELTFRPFEFRRRSVDYLPIPNAFPEALLVEVFKRRRSRRHFEELQRPALSALLWIAAKTDVAKLLPSGFLWQHRGAPSAGGRHPVHVLVLSTVDREPTARLYDPIAHALIELEILETPLISDFLKTLDAVVPLGAGTVFWFVAEYSRTLGRYEDGESLVWRDAGALLAAFCLAAEAAELSCCPFGLTGDQFVRSLFRNEILGGVGGLVVGTRGCDLV
jgi:nitroreductase